uniref:ZP domain-containing protein n=1 Tax=Haemonchus placei TaxID=6290 RepID=A0A0N4WDB5_HAEPC
MTVQSHFTEVPLVFDKRHPWCASDGKFNATSIDVLSLQQPGTLNILRAYCSKLPTSSTVVEATPMEIAKRATHTKSYLLLQNSFASSGYHVPAKPHYTEIH